MKKARRKRHTFIHDTNPIKRAIWIISSLILKPQNLFLKKKLEAFIPLHERYRHTHITGNTGSGKSVLLAGLIFSVLRTQKASLLLKGDKKDRLQVENFVLIDPHGDLSDDIFRMSLKFHQHLDFSTYLLDPFLDNQKTPVINPFEFEGNETELNSYTEELVGVFREILGTEFYPECSSFAYSLYSYAHRA